MLSGSSGPRHGRLTLFALALCWMVGGVTGMLLGSIAVGDAVSALFFILIGGLIATAVALPAWPVAAIGAGVGLVQGYADGSDLIFGRDGVSALIGISAAVFVGFALAAAVALQLRSPLGRIAIRVAGSWIAAAGVLLLGWSLQRAFRMGS